MLDTTVKRHRSPAYPMFGLKTAVEKMKMFYATQKHNAAYVDVAASTLGYDSQSSKGMRAIAALISFGLMTEEGSSQARKVKLTPNAIKIALLPNSDREHTDLLRAAAVKPTIYREMVSQWKEDLPSDEQIKKYLLFEKNFNPEVVVQVIRDFKSTYTFADLSNKGILLDEVFDKDEKDDDRPADGNNPKGGWKVPAPPGKLHLPPQGVGSPVQEKQGHEPMQQGVLNNQPDIRTYTLPILDGRIAVLQAPSDLSADDFEILLLSLEVIKKSVERRSKHAERPNVMVGPAIWHGSDTDQSVTVTGYVGELNGKKYVSVEGSSAGVPLDEIEFVARNSHN